MKNDGSYRTVSDNFSSLCNKYKLKLSSFKSSYNINEKENGSYRGFGYFSLIGDPLSLAKRASSENCCNFANFNRAVDTKIGINSN